MNFSGLLRKLSLLVSFSFVISSCQTINKQLETTDEIIARESHQKIFYANYDEVWKAAHLALKYTIAAENQDFGVIETDYIKAVDGWLAPFMEKPQYPASRYKIFINFAKGQKVNNRESVRVTIEKKTEVFKDFVSEVRSVDSDGFEEKSLFYRMEREIIISQALKKAAAASN